MKRILIFCFLLSFTTINSQENAQYEEGKSGMLGDDFSLDGALEMFKDATSMEAFEAMLNTEDKAINNLDLNDDGEIDYIRVEDYMEGEVHAIVLQAVIGEEEFQDIAVIEIEKTGSESANLQIVGDEYLYGEGAYVEPFEVVANSNGKGGPSVDYNLSRVVVNVWLWPSVRYIYAPRYSVYRSPFRWRVYPRAWKPWRPLSWNVYHGKRHHYHNHYRYVNTHRVIKARKIYTPRRKSSNVVVRKSKTVTKVSKSKNGNTVVKRKTKTTKVKKEKSNKVKGKKTTKTKKVIKGKNGKKVTRTKKVKKKSGN